MQIDEAYSELNIIQDFIPAGNSNRPGKLLDLKSITIHNTDNSDAGANAAAHAKYQKGADAHRREVSWHYTVDDGSVYQSLPINEIGWHSSSKEGNATSIGIEICMNAGLDVPAAYKRAALLVAVLAFQNGIGVTKIFQHYDWSRKNCPRVLRATPSGWSDFLQQIKDFRKGLTAVPSAAISMRNIKDHHRLT